MTFELDLTGRRALVTGAGQGVGRGIALALAKAGAEVVVNDLLLERANAVVDEVRELDGAAVAAAFDVTTYDKVADAVAQVGGVDVLVNNAGNAGAEGMPQMVSFAETGPKDWDRYLQVNLFGVLNCTRAVLPGMIERRWGRVVTIVSDAARTGDKGLSVYGAAKAAAASFTRSIAMENGKYGITANNISLGTIRTPISDTFWAQTDDQAVKAMLQRYAVRRPGAPDDIAPLAVLLASQHSDWITGQTYPVNGGSSVTL